MRFTLLLVFIAAIGVTTKAQLLIGPTGGYNINDIYLGSTGVRTAIDGSSNVGLLLTYLPEGKKPGFRISMTKTSVSFMEVGDTYSYRFQSSGYDLHFLTHMYFGFGKTRLFINAGPGLALLSDLNTENRPFSELPAFEEGNVNTFFLQLMGGGGITQQIGKIHLSVFGNFSFFATKVFPKNTGFSNPLITRIGMSLQVPISK